MKIGIVGVGKVGSARALALVTRGSAMSPTTRGVARKRRSPSHGPRDGCRRGKTDHFKICHNCLGLSLLHLPKSARGRCLGIEGPDRFFGLRVGIVSFIGRFVARVEDLVAIARRSEALDWEARHQLQLARRSTLTRRAAGGEARSLRQDFLPRGYGCVRR